MIERIKTINDVESFAKQLVAEGLSFHPDNDFKDYVFLKENKPCFSEEEAVKRNKLMTQCFKVCEEHGFDIYAFMLEVTLRETRMDEYIPLPSTNIELI